MKNHYEELIRRLEKAWVEQLSRKERNEGATAIGLRQAITIVNEVFKSNE